MSGIGLRGPTQPVRSDRDYSQPGNPTSDGYPLLSTTDNTTDVQAECLNRRTARPRRNDTNPTTGQGTTLTAPAAEEATAQPVPAGDGQHTTEEKGMGRIRMSGATEVDVVDMMIVATMTLAGRPRQAGITHKTIVLNKTTATISLLIRPTRVANNMPTTNLISPPVPL